MGKREFAITVGDDRARALVRELVGKREPDFDYFDGKHYANRPEGGSVRTWVVGEEKEPVVEISILGVDDTYKTDIIVYPKSMENKVERFMEKHPSPERLLP